MEAIRIPEWLLPWILGCSFWYAVVFLFVSPELTQRALDRHIVAECNRNTTAVNCECIIDDIQVAGRMSNALFVASFGLSDSRPRRSGTPSCCRPTRPGNVLLQAVL